MLELWTISSTPGMSPPVMAALASACSLLVTEPRSAGASPGSGVAAAVVAVSSVARSPAAAATAPRRLRRTRVVCNEVTASSLVSRSGSNGS
ncbi:hypothetical protein SCALM49S_08494 [Streptomyces californicus]